MSQPFNAWIFTKGLETLSLRMRAHCANAQALAEWLEAHPAVERVHYSGLTSHAQHELAARQQGAFGAVLGFEVRGGREGAWSVIDATRLLSITGNLGDAKSTITHPGTTTHGRLSEAQKASAGISEGLIRVAVGSRTSRTFVLTWRVVWMLGRCLHVEWFFRMKRSAIFSGPDDRRNV